ncbi:MAG: deoxyribonuclease IV [Candidatus Eremiobacteraeota bacterium]|nr:deoxyribonuclease IV [Candidatus Eremiobacteraeota bacterium]
MMKIGAHVSASGGAHHIFQRGAELECECLQLFTRAPSQWKAKPLTEEQVELFLSERALHGNPSVIAHDIYLNNLAAEEDRIRRRSIKTMVEEVTRCHQLGIDGLVCHLGSHPGGSKPGIRRYASAIKTILSKTEGAPTPILLETCAGQGNCLGHQLEDIAEVIRRNDGHPRLGVCVDTCHIFVAGYDLRSLDQYQTFWERFDALIGLPRLKAFHLNDSKKPLGSRVDRHDHIAEGEIGESTFRYLLSDPRFEGLPAVIETPESKTMAKINLERLRSLRKVPSAAATK